MTYLPAFSDWPNRKLNAVSAATLDDLKALKNIIGDLHWPTAAPASSYTYDYASQTMVGGKY
ncbi:hypothetical protein MJL79_30995, partial [Salmonella enterica subsp. enterica serovar Montevideo]|nr:hypothetical protein [Salmonella enterica subsp. enterica serovar Montevideo]